MQTRKVKAKWSPQGKLIIYLLLTEVDKEKCDEISYYVKEVFPDAQVEYYKDPLRVIHILEKTAGNLKQMNRNNLILVTDYVNDFSATGVSPQLADLEKAVKNAKRWNYLYSIFYSPYKCLTGGQHVVNTYRYIDTHVVKLSQDVSCCKDLLEELQKLVVERRSEPYVPIYEAVEDTINCYEEAEEQCAEAA